MYSKKENAPFQIIHTAVTISQRLCLYYCFVTNKKVLVGIGEVKVGGQRK